MNPTPPPSPAGWRKPAIRALKAAVAVLVFWGVGRHVARTWDELSRDGATPRIEPWWLALSGLAYLIGLVLCGAFYRDVLTASPTPIGLFPAVRAYLISHLGKYVPGKAVVVVMRAALSTPYGARASTSAVATFYETLVMMASGALIAALIFASGGDSPVIALDREVLGFREVRAFVLFALIAGGLSAAFLTVVAPPVFRRLAGVFARKVPGMGVDALSDFTWGLMARGLALTGISWLFLGLSQVAAAKGLSGMGSPELDLTVIPVAVASVALATVAGFVVAVAPGGLGVRESVLMYALGPAFGPGRAVAAALMLRLVWVAVEALAALVLGPLGRPAKPNEPESEAVAAEVLQESVPMSEAP
ncbi:lysylphosphatidylglycerol synthase transmembrane domain-containing protein [Paludisphaera soli]|uniref:lysylphosphatidylglycerol synthase transmembrane domain-containing protein n=1 Tax=Paludisphaera soli TaxID=2712865 RepID=UPI0013ED8ABF|nr:lysylphosphatidylglycerol synthase transmembrane domain-containing protein [Paludisphaera soli]